MLSYSDLSSPGAVRCPRPGARPVTRRCRTDGTGVQSCVPDHSHANHPPSRHDRSQMPVTRTTELATLLLALLTAVALVVSSLPLQAADGADHAGDMAHRDCCDPGDPCCPPAGDCPPHGDAAPIDTETAAHSSGTDDCCPTGHDDSCPPGCHDCFLACCGGIVALAGGTAIATDPPQDRPRSLPPYCRNLSSADGDAIDHPPRS
jgi:hypothetical protein